MTFGTALLDTDTLSEIIKGRNLATQHRAQEYLSLYPSFQFSIITRYEILRGLKAKGASAQVQAFDRQCRSSIVLPLSDEIVVQGAGIFAGLRQRGGIISDADILIAATAIVHGLVLVTNNLKHFQRIEDLRVETWTSSAAL